MELVKKCRSGIVWGMLAILLISIALVHSKEYSLTNFSTTPTPGILGLCIMSWFPFVCFARGFIQPSFYKRLLVADIPFVLSAIFISYYNIKFLDPSSLMYEESLVSLFQMSGFLPISAFYFHFVRQELQKA